MATALEVLAYRNGFKNAEGKYYPTSYFNDSLLHATIVMREILEKAAGEPGKLLNMYCGKFSLFRDNTQSKVTALKFGCPIDENINQSDLDIWNKFNPFNELQNQLVTFIDGGGVLNLILEYEVESLRENKVWAVLNRGIHKGNVNVFYLKDGFGSSHFAATEDAFRLESSDDYKTASCCFVNKEKAAILNDNFKTLRSRSTRVFV